MKNLYFTLIALSISFSSFATVDRILGDSVLCASATITLSDSTAHGAWSSHNTAIATVGSGTGVVTGVSAGVDTVSYTVSGTSVTRVITINPLPATGTITGTASVCAGSVTILSNAASGGVWSSSSTAIATVGTTGKVTGVAAGTASIVYTTLNSYGCTANTHSVVTVNPLPVSGTVSGAPIICVGSLVTYNDGASGGVWSSSNTAVAAIGSTGVDTAITSGPETITYTVINGCGTARSTLVVTVELVEPSGVITGISKICTGSLNQLYESIAGGTWVSSNTSVATVSLETGYVTGVAHGTATITYTASDYCSTTTYPVTITPLPAPAITVTGAMLLSTNIYPSYEWELDSNIIIAATFRSYTMLQNGYYTLVVTDTNNCTASSSVYDFTDEQVKNVAQGTNSIQIFPNPNNGSFTLHISAAQNEPATITITNILGEKVKQLTTTTNTNTEIQLNAPAGNYIISAATIDGTLTQKIELW